MTEREIVEWVAQARVGDVPPFMLKDLRTAMENIGYEIPEGSALDGPSMTKYAKAVLEDEGPEGP